MTTPFTFRCALHVRTATFKHTSSRLSLHVPGILKNLSSMAIRPAPESVAKAAVASIHQPRDPNTLSNYNAWRTKHTAADFEIDFNAKRLKGTVHLTLERLAKDSDRIILDSR